MTQAGIKVHVPSEIAAQCDKGRHVADSDVIGQPLLRKGRKYADRPRDNDPGCRGECRPRRSPSLPLRQTTA